MPAVHFKDEEDRTIFTAWNGDSSDNDLFEARNNNFRNIKYSPELSDFSDSRGVKLSINTLIELGKMASRHDKPPHTKDREKMAIVIGSSMTYGLTRIYGIYRGYNPQSSKEVQVCRNRDDAVAWLKAENGITPGEFLFHSETQSE